MGDGATSRKEIPAGMWRRGLRTARYVQALGLWQGRWLSLREALGDRRQVAVTYRGRRVVLRLGTSDILVLCSIFEREDYGVELSPPPDTIIDAGAYTGFSAIYFAEKYPAAKILALEPDPENFALLVRNVRHYPGIVPLKAALWHEDGYIDLRDPGAGHWSLFVGQEDPEGTRVLGRVEAVSVRTLIERFGLRRIGLLKLNVEGAEKEILEGSEDWIGRVEAVFTALHDRFRPGCAESFEKATGGFDHKVRRAGMICVIRGPVSPG